MKINYMKWTIQMTQEEPNRKTCSDKAIDGRSTQKAAAETLGISERQFRSPIRRCQHDVEAVLVLHQRGKPTNQNMQIRNSIPFVVNFLDKR